jgi:hypothetical protein
MIGITVGTLLLALCGGLFAFWSMRRSATVRKRLHTYCKRTRPQPSYWDEVKPFRIHQP